LRFKVGVIDFRNSWGVVGDCLVDNLVRLRIIIIKDDISISRADGSNVLLLDDLFGLVVEWDVADPFEDATDNGERSRRTVEDIIIGMMRAPAEVDSDSSLRNMMEVKLSLGSYGSSLTIGMLYHADSTERKETFEWIKVEVRVLLVEQGVRSRRCGEGRLGG
jgi:transcriptional regulator of NAD metabolism